MPCLYMLVYVSRCSCPWMASLCEKQHVDKNNVLPKGIIWEQ